MHLVSDATHGVPLAFTITPANDSDSTQLPAALRKTLAAHPWMEPGCLLADRGYDSLANHQFLVGLGIIPVIHIRKPTAQDGLYDGIYTAEGKPTCMGQQPMEYVRTDPETGEHLFRCQAGGCPLKTEGTKAVIYCDGEVWEAPDANLRVLGPLPRFTEAWKRLYRLRMSIERVFRSFKHSRGLEGHCLRGLRKITLQATLSVLTYQATRAGPVAGRRAGQDAPDDGEGGVEPGVVCSCSKRSKGRVKYPALAMFPGGPFNWYTKAVQLRERQAQFLMEKHLSSQPNAAAVIRGNTTGALLLSRETGPGSRPPPLFFPLLPSIGGTVGGKGVWNSCSR